jgi:glutaredoxin
MIVIYGAEWCTYCLEAKEYCREKGLHYSYVDIENIDLDFIDEEFEPAKPIPQIFEEGRKIGGFDDLVKLYGL